MLEEPQDKLAKEQRSLKARDFFSLESMALGLESYLEDLSIFGLDPEDLSTSPWASIASTILAALL